MGRSGRQERLVRSRAYAGGMASAASRKRKWPLRRVIASGQFPLGMMPTVKVYREVLECGHLIRPPHDMIGETGADRRRCGKCFESKPRDVDPEAYSERCPACGAAKDEGDHYECIVGEPRR